jgi:hypothetical protein
MTPLQSDAAKFLELLLSECGGGPSEHAWRKCRRCLAIAHIESHDKTARRLLETARDALTGGNQLADAERAVTPAASEAQ